MVSSEQTTVALAVWQKVNRHHAWLELEALEVGLPEAAAWSRGVEVMLRKVATKRSSTTALAMVTSSVGAAAQSQEVALEAVIALTATTAVVKVMAAYHASAGLPEEALEVAAVATAVPPAAVVATLGQESA